MKKIMFLILATLFIITTTTASANAAEYNELGYYNATIFIQNNLTKYQSDFDAAINRNVGTEKGWNHAGVIGRSIVVNNVSSSSITNVDFRDINDLWEPDYQGAYGAYTVLTTLNYACTCHIATSFIIRLNEHYMDELNYADDQLNINMRRKVIVHEFGHALGLIDYYNGVHRYDSVMHNESEFYSYLPVYPSSFDVANANTCWAPHR